MPTLALSQLQQNVYDRLEQNTVFYTAPTLTSAINEAYRITNAFCAINQTSVSVPGFSVANQLLYSVPIPILFPLEVYFEGRQLRKISLGAIARSYRSWALDTTAKFGSVQRWAPIGITKFAIHPADSIGGRDIQMTGVIEPTLLVNPTDTISVEDEYIEMICDYAAHRVQLREGGKVFADSSLFIQEFWRRIKDRCDLTGIKFPRYYVVSGPTQ